jgi:hypothetical protein
MTVVDTSRENIQKKKFDVTYLSIEDDQGSRRKIDVRDTERLTKKNSFFESIPKNIRL